MSSPTPPPTLFMICGKIAAGKSSLAARLAAQAGTVLISEDALLTGLYPGEISTLQDYVRCSKRIRAVMEPHILSLFATGISVVLDFPANTIENRRWMRRLFEQAGAAHELHFLDVPDDVCKARLRRRNAAGEHGFQTSDEQFDQITSYFVPPSAQEGFHIVTHTA